MCVCIARSIYLIRLNRHVPTSVEFCKVNALALCYWEHIVQRELLLCVHLRDHGFMCFYGTKEQYVIFNIWWHSVSITRGYKNGALRKCNKVSKRIYVHHSYISYQGAIHKILRMHLRGRGGWRKACKDVRWRTHVRDSECLKSLDQARLIVGSNVINATNKYKCSRFR